MSRYEYELFDLSDVEDGCEQTCQLVQCSHCYAIGYCIDNIDHEVDCDANVVLTTRDINFN